MARPLVLSPLAVIMSNDSDLREETAAKDLRLLLRMDYLLVPHEPRTKKQLKGL
jgi:hypothetical protein